MYQTAEKTALMVAVLISRAAKTRVRISDKTMRILAKRTNLRGAFLPEVRDYLEGLGLALIELDRGGFGVISISLLEGAPAITASRLIPAAERKNLDEHALWAELKLSEEPNED